MPMDYQEAIEYIHSTLWRGSRLGLKRMKELSESMSSPEKDLKFIHIAGTNGKGSVAAMLSTILTLSGYNTGMFTSPYVTKFTERIQINSRPISESDLARETEYVRPFAEQMEDKPTEFELVTAIALSYFRRMECDIVVFETGMGGALDSTNVIGVPEIAIITSIGLDHMEQLGDTIEEIARTKAGIIKHGGEVLAYGGGEDVRSVLTTACAENNARLTWADFDSIISHGQAGPFQIFDWKQFKGLELSLRGGYQLNNAAMALGAVDILRQRGWSVPENAVRDALKSVRWPGRFEQLLECPVFILDGGHNPSGTAAAAESLKTMYPARRFVFLTGVMADKDVEAMYHPLLGIAERFFTVTPNTPRSMPSDVLAQRLANMGIPSQGYPSIDAAVSAAINFAGTDGVICAIGSLYMAGEIRDIILSRKTDLIS